MEEKKYDLLGRVNADNINNNLILNEKINWVLNIKYVYPELNIDQKIEFLKDYFIYLKTKPKFYKTPYDSSLDKDWVVNYLEEKHLNIKYFRDFYGFCFFMRIYKYNNISNIYEKKMVLYFCNYGYSDDFDRNEVIYELFNTMDMKVLNYIFDTFLVSCLKDFTGFLLKRSNYFRLIHYCHDVYPVFQGNYDYNDLSDYLNKLSKFFQLIDKFNIKNNLKKYIYVNIKEDAEKLFAEILEKIDKKLLFNITFSRRRFLIFNSFLIFGCVEILEKGKRVKAYGLIFFNGENSLGWVFVNIFDIESILLILDIYVDAKKPKDEEYFNDSYYSQYLNSGYNFNHAYIDTFKIIELQDLKHLKAYLNFVRLNDFLINNDKKKSKYEY